jgi:hypothetical protein
MGVSFVYRTVLAFCFLLFFPLVLLAIFGVMGWVCWEREDIDPFLDFYWLFVSRLLLLFGRGYLRIM